MHIFLNTVYLLPTIILRNEVKMSFPSVLDTIRAPDTCHLRGSARPREMENVIFYCCEKKLFLFISSMSLDRKKISIIRWNSSIRHYLRDYIISTFFSLSSILEGKKRMKENREIMKCWTTFFRYRHRGVTIKPLLNSFRSPPLVVVVVVLVAISSTSERSGEESTATAEGKEGDEGGGGEGGRRKARDNERIYVYTRL